MFKRTPRLSSDQQEVLVQMFIRGYDAEEAAFACGINRATAKQWFRYFRELILEETRLIPRFTGDVEIDHTYFGTTQKRKGDKGTRAWSHNKIIVLGIYDRNLNGGTLYTQIIPDAKSSTILPVVRCRVDKSAIIHTDDWRGFEQLSDEGYQRFSVNHYKEVYYDKNTDTHTGHVDNFWGRAKKKYRDWNGVPKKIFSLFLKEQEFRFNHRESKDKKAQKREDCFPYVFQRLLKKRKNGL